jgi:hypothetical protein
MERQISFCPRWRVREQTMEKSFNKHRYSIISTPSLKFSFHEMLGYAEADPTADVEGYDVQVCANILTSSGSS